MDDKTLAIITDAERRLATCESPTDAADVADVAEAARVYAKRAGASVGVINKAVRIKLNAERKAGELLAGMDMKTGPKPIGDGVSPIKLADLGISKKQSSRWQSLDRIPANDWGSFTEKDDRELTSALAYKLAKKHNTPQGVKRAEPVDGICTEFSQIVDMGVKFGTIYADPPWRYTNQSTRGSTDDHYDGTMSVEELCALPVGDITEDKAHLHLWTTNAFLFETQKIMEAWGFEYKSTFVWVKPQMGMGNYWRNSHEIMITAVKGGLTADSKAEMSWVECKRGRHSSKPQQVRESIMKLSPGPYLELFGRRNIKDWVVFGNQIEEELI